MFEQEVGWAGTTDRRRTVKSEQHQHPRCDHVSLVRNGNRSVMDTGLTYTVVQASTCPALKVLVLSTSILYPDASRLAKRWLGYTLSIQCQISTLSDHRSTGSESPRTAGLYLRAYSITFVNFGIIKPIGWHFEQANPTM